MKKIIIIPILICLLIGFVNALDGSGSSVDPYLIHNCSEFQDISSNLSANYQLENDIDCTGITHVRLTGFNGNLNGQMHDFTGITSGNNGLFTTITSGGVVRNLNIKNLVITGNGFVARDITLATVQNVQVKDSRLTGGSETGGIGGDCRGISFYNISIVNVNITGFRGVGGICGILLGDPTIGSISDFLILNSKITSTESTFGLQRGGGFTGSKHNTNIYRGFTNANIGGWGSPFIDDYQTVGQLYQGVFYDNQTIHTGTVSPEQYATGMSTTDMKTQSNYPSWDFDNTWGIIEGYTYPYLLSFPILPDPIIELIIPNEQVRTNQQIDNITYKLQFSINHTIECSLFVDGVLNNTNDSVQKDNLTVINDINFNDGLHSYYINCSDYNRQIISDTFYYELDTNEPFIQTSTPHFMNTTIFTDYTMNLIGNVTDDNIWKVNRSIFFPNGTIFHNNYSGVLSNLTIYSWTDTFNTTFLPNGQYLYNIEAIDLGELNVDELNIKFQINNCVPDWVCIDYDTCNTTDQARCVMVQDNNYCGLGFGTLGETFDDYEPLSCDYCNDDSVFLSQTDCVDGNRTRYFNDLNFSTCCNVTGIDTDCVGDEVQTTALGQIDIDCPINYNSNDIAPALINLIVLGFLFIGSIITVIVIWVLFLKSSNKIKGRK